jgi:hypothetical protein
VRRRDEVEAEAVHEEVADAAVEEDVGEEGPDLAGPYAGAGQSSVVKRGVGADPDTEDLLQDEASEQQAEEAGEHGRRGAGGVSAHVGPVGQHDSRSVGVRRGNSRARRINALNHASCAAMAA